MYIYNTNIVIFLILSKMKTYNNKILFFNKNKSKEVFHSYLVFSWVALYASSTNCWYYDFQNYELYQQ